MESQELSTKIRISEEMARSELEVMEKDARYTSFHQTSTTPNRCPRMSKTGKRCRHWAVQESSECVKFWWWKKFEVSRTDMKDEWVRKWKKSGIFDWIRSTRSCTWSEKPDVTRTSSTSPSRRKGQRVFKKPDALGAALTRRQLLKSLVRTRSSTRASSPKLPKPRTQRGAAKSLVTNWGAHHEVFEGKFPWNFR